MSLETSRWDKSNIAPLALILFALTLANLVVFLINAILFQTLTCFLLTILLPGFLASTIILPQQKGEADDSLSRLVMGLGLGYAIAIAGTLFLHYLPGPVKRGFVVLFYDVLVVGLLAARYAIGRQSAASPLGSPFCSALLGLMVLIFIAAGFRFLNLGYAEFQGDEVAVLHKAAASIQGRQDALFLHRKGPAEILLSISHYALVGRTNEWAARFPFSFANSVGVLALYAVGRQALSRKAGWWAALLVALNGFLVAFGRIVQYQSLVFLFSTLAILAALRFAKTDGESSFRDSTRRRTDLYLTAMFLAMGLLSHSDAIFAVVTCGFIILKTLWCRRGRHTVSTLTILLGPALLAGLLLASFYIPFALHPTFETTQGYLKWRMGTRPPYNNLNVLLNLGTVYNTIYYLAFLAVALAWALVAHTTQRKRKGWALLAVLAALVVTRFAFPSAWHTRGRDLTGLLFALPVAFLLLNHSGENRGATFQLGWQASLVWFGTPFLIYMFAFREPRTHIYTFFPGAALLAGTELSRLAESHWETWLVRSVAGIILLVSAAYLYIAFVDHTPEYKRTYAQSRIPFFWTPFGKEMPDRGLFGFPYRAGWKVVGQLYAIGALEGDYNTNEEPHITRWYTRGEHLCQIQPRYYFVAENVQDEQAISRDDIQSNYTHFGTVWVGDTPKLRLYERGTADLPYQDYQASEAAPSFDQKRTDPSYPTGLPPQDPVSQIQHPVYRRLGQSIEFLGYDLDTTRIRPGDVLVLTLYWRAIGKVGAPYTVFTHVEDSGTVWAQKDHPPLCGRKPTNAWEPGRVYVDPYVIVTDAEIPPGPHPIFAGMYCFDTGERLPVFNTQGEQLGGAMKLATVTVSGR